MARVWIERTYPDGDRIEVGTDVELLDLQSLSEAMAVTLHAFREACGVAQTPAPDET